MLIENDPYKGGANEGTVSEISSTIFFLQADQNNSFLQIESIDYPIISLSMLLVITQTVLMLLIINHMLLKMPQSHTACQVIETCQEKALTERRWSYPVKRIKTTGCVQIRST